MAAHPSARDPRLSFHRDPRMHSTPGSPAQCPVCQGPRFNDTHLPCGHVVCFDCVRRAQEQPYTPTHFLCPVCKKDHPGDFYRLPKGPPTHPDTRTHRPPPTRDRPDPALRSSLGEATLRHSGNGAHPMDWAQEKKSLLQQVAQERQKLKSTTDQKEQEMRELRRTIQEQTKKIRTLEQQTSEKSSQSEHWEQQIRVVRRQLQERDNQLRTKEEAFVSLQQDLDLLKAKFARVQEENGNLKLEQQRHAQAPAPVPVDRSQELFAQMQQDLKSQWQQLREGLLSQQSQLATQLTHQMTELQQSVQSSLASMPASTRTSVRESPSQPHGFPPSTHSAASLHSELPRHSPLNHSSMSGQFLPQESAPSPQRPVWPPEPRPYLGYETLTRL